MVRSLLSVLVLFASIAQGICQVEGDIWLAIKNSQPEKVDAWIDAGHNLEVLGDKGRTPLLAAAAGEGGMHIPERQKKIVLSLLQAGANVNAQDDKGLSAMHYLAYHGNHDLLKVLLDKGADQQLRSEKGESALILAAKGPLLDEDRRKCLSILLQAGSDPELAAENGRTALHWLCAHKAELESPEMVDQMLRDLSDSLIAHGAKIHSLDKQGHSAFSLALVQGHLTTAQWLLAKGANPRVAALSGFNALHWATEHCSGELLTKLAGQGLDINATIADKKQAEGKPYFFPKGSSSLDIALISEHECKADWEKKEWHALAGLIRNQGGISKTYEEYVKGFKVMKGAKGAGSSKIR